MQPIFKNISLALFILVAFISCSKDKAEASNGKIETSAVIIMSHRSIKSGGVISESKTSVIQRGVCYSTSANPDITKKISKDGTGLGSFTSNIGQLTANTKYYLRAYMVNGEGTSYGNTIEFTTPDYPTENIWTLNENTHATSVFQWIPKDLNFVGAEVSPSELNGITIKFKQKPITSQTYKLVNKIKDLESDECSIIVISARNPYVGNYLYTSETPHNIQVEVINNKCKIIIPTVNVYEANDTEFTLPISLKGVLVEK